MVLVESALATSRLCSGVAMTESLRCPPLSWREDLLETATIGVTQLAAIPMM